MFGVSRGPELALPPAKVEETVLCACREDRRTAKHKSMMGISYDQPKSSHATMIVRWPMRSWLSLSILERRAIIFPGNAADERDRQGYSALRYAEFRCMGLDRPEEKLCTT